MTAGQSMAVLPSSQVSELLQGVVKALRAFQMYLPNNPIYQRAIENLTAAFRPIWAATDELVLQVVETDLVWEEQTVYQQLQKSESLAWILYKDGMRTLTLRRGCETDEIVQFLQAVNRARFLPADAGDDLLTLLWEEEFQWISYQFSEPFGDLNVPEAETPVAAATEEATAERQALVQEEAPPRPSGVVDLDEFDSTLYFLDESEINYIAEQVTEEYRRDVRASALAVLFDLFELQPTEEIRNEILLIVDQLFPNLLNAGEFRTVAMILRELRVLRERGPALTASHRERLESIEVQLSQPDIIRQLIQSLDQGATLPAEGEVSELLRELRPSALEAIVSELPHVSSASLRKLLEATADRLATGNTAEVLRLLHQPESAALLGIIGLCGRLQLQGAVPGLGELLSHADPAVRLATVQALVGVGSPSALLHLDRAIDDEDRSVRLAAVRAAGARGNRSALRRVEPVVLGKVDRTLDLTEKMAFFEAYGQIAGSGGLPNLAGILLPRGLLRRKEHPETRACAAIAIGRVGGAEARQILEQAGDDKELVVRNAVSRALRELGR